MNENRNFKIKYSKGKDNTKKVKLICIFVLLVLMVIIIMNAISIYYYSNVDETQRADVAVVLGAGTEGENPSPVFCERLNHCIWLYSEGYVNKVLLTGGFGNNTISDSEIAKEYAMKNGIPEESISTESQSTITQENLYYSKELMDEFGYDSALIISDPLHMKRAMLMANDLGMHAFASPTRTSAYKGWWPKAKFLGREVFFYIGYKLYRVIRI